MAVDLSKATPRPWRYASHDNMILGGNDERLVAQPRSIDVGLDERDANGALVVEAVNNHDRLLRVERVAKELAVMADNIDICDVQAVKAKVRELQGEIGKGAV